MGKKLLLLALFASSKLLMGQEILCSQDSKANDPATAQELAADYGLFAFDFYQELSSNSGNLVFSPFSVSTALAMTYAGASGETAEEMARTLHFGADIHSKARNLSLAILCREGVTYQLNVANALWGQTGYGFDPTFLATLTNNYGSPLQEIDFAADPEAARNDVNAWVSEQTEGKITDILPPGSIDNLTRFALANAIYYKGAWQIPFVKDLTSEAPFYLETGEQVDVPMMSHEGAFSVYENDALQAIELRIASDETLTESDQSMLIILPRDRRGLAAVEANLSLAKVQEIRQQATTEQVSLFLPKFKFLTQIALKDALAAMGMPSAFEPGTADFSAMLESGVRDIYLSAAIHKAFIDVNEEGIEAAAATAVTGSTTSLPPPPTVEFKADHPFAFMIIDDDTGAILFAGRLADPR
jgi:serpin B